MQTAIEHPEVLDQIAVVLVRPLGDGNIGQVARAMKNFGLPRLLLVNPCETNTDFCRQMASGAYEIVQRAPCFASLPDALAGIQYVVGTSRRVGRFRRRFAPSRAFPGWLLPRLTGGQTAALVFGNEAHGLSNEELDICSLLVEIETDPGHRSLNLAQAVLVLSYELFSTAARTSMDIDKHQPATHEQMERLFSHMRRIYLEVGFLSRHNPEAIMRSIRRLFTRTAPDEREIRILRGILQDTEWYFNHIAEKGVRDGYREMAGNRQS